MSVGIAVDIELLAVLLEVFGGPLEPVSLEPVIWTWQNMGMVGCERWLKETYR